MVEALSDGCDADTERGGFLVAQVGGDLDLCVAFDSDVVAECAVFVVDFVATVAEACDAVAFLKWLRDFAADFLNDTCVVASNLQKYWSDWRL